MEWLASSGSSPVDQLAECEGALRSLNSALHSIPCHCGEDRRRRSLQVSISRLMVLRELLAVEAWRERCRWIVEAK